MNFSKKDFVAAYDALKKNGYDATYALSDGNRVHTITVHGLAYPITLVFTQQRGAPMSLYAWWGIGEKYDDRDFTSMDDGVRFFFRKASLMRRQALKQKAPRPHEREYPHDEPDPVDLPRGNPKRCPCPRGACSSTCGCEGRGCPCVGGGCGCARANPVYEPHERAKRDAVAAAERAVKGVKFSAKIVPYNSKVLKLNFNEILVVAADRDISSKQYTAFERAVEKLGWRSWGEGERDIAFKPDDVDLSLPRSNPAGTTPFILQRMVVSILEKNPSYDTSRAFAIATSQAQRFGYLKRGTREVTRKGHSKEASYSARERATTERKFERLVRENPRMSDEHEDVLARERRAELTRANRALRSAERRWLEFYFPRRKHLNPQSHPLYLKLERARIRANEALDAVNEPRENPSHSMPREAERILRLSMRLRSMFPSAKVDEGPNHLSIEVEDDDAMVYSWRMRKETRGYSITKFVYELGGAIGEDKNGNEIFERKRKSESVSGTMSLTDAARAVEDAVGARVYGRAGWMKRTKQMREAGVRVNPSVAPVRADNLAKFGLPATPGGQYLEMPSRKILTGNIYAGGHIDTTGARPSFVVSEALAPALSKKGKITKVNLFRRSGRWKWIEGGRSTAEIEGTPVIVSVETGGMHLYALRVEFDCPVELKTYPKAKTEPRLRPTARVASVLTEGSVGSIRTAGKEHWVYGRIVLR